METPAVATQTKLFFVTMAASVCDSVTNYEVDTSIFRMGRDSSVCIATRYGLDISGDRIPLGARFSAPVQTGPGAHPASYRMDAGSFSRG
jgi:hypothetical protein